MDEPRNPYAAWTAIETFQIGGDLFLGGVPQPLELLLDGRFHHRPLGWGGQQERRGPCRIGVDQFEERLGSRGNVAAD
jgi:hypothetical protein